MARKRDDSYDARLKRFLVSILRRATYRWPERNAALSAARIERGLYKCAMCQGSFKKDEVDIDHSLPVVNISNGFTNWDDYIKGMFPDADGFQILCKSCHDVKTDLENTMRQSIKDAKKQENS